MNEANYNKFLERLTEHYTSLFQTPEYSMAAKMGPPKSLAFKMTNDLWLGHANIDGEGIRRTCKDLGIKHTYKAIRAYLNGEAE